MPLLPQSKKLTSPPRADLAFRIGIVGHRPDRLPEDKDSLDALRRMLRCILEAAKTEVSEYASSSEAKLLYSARPPVLRAVSPLAEGADRIFAEQAIDLGYEFLCPMPFSQEEYERDFLPPKAQEDQSCRRFRDLLKRAREGAGLTTFNLDGERSAAAEAYGAAGRVMLNQSDLLVAIWDGGKPAGGGGTVQTLKEAIHYHVPVLWIDALAPHTWQLLHAEDDLSCLEGNDRCMPRGTHPTEPAETRKIITETIKGIVADELGLPRPPSKPHGTAITRSHAAGYFRERKPWFNFAFLWKLFRDLVGKGQFRIPRILVRDFEDQISNDWPIRKDIERSSVAPSAEERTADVEYIPSAVEDWVNRRLRPHYAWSDQCSDMYADAYRSAYVSIYLFSATAVFIALLPMAVGMEVRAQIICGAIEFGLLLVILLVVGRARRWHERWLEYRLLAELIRQIRFLTPLGGGRPFPRVPIHLGAYASLNQSWMYWHMRAIARATGIPQAEVTTEYVLDCLRHLAKVVGGPNGGQLEFHTNNKILFDRIAHRLHAASTALFLLTIIGVVIHLALGLSASAPMPPWLHVDILHVDHAVADGWLVLAAATLPALGAALAGIANQGEFARLAKRSAAMADAFEQFVAQVKGLQPDASRGRAAPKLSQVIPLAGKIAEVMVDEVADWRVIVTEQPVRPV